MRQRLLLCLIPALLSLGGAARAQTILRLSAEGDVQAVPDQITATLMVQTNAHHAAAAQAALNKSMAAALADARSLHGVVATTQDYGIQDTSEKQNGTQFQASQTLVLTMPAAGGVPDADFTSLLGRLQGESMLLNGLDGNLSEAGRAAARRQAVTKAIRTIQDEAGSVAAALNQKVGIIKSLNLDAPQVNAPAMAPMMMKAAVGGAPPPSAAPGPVPVSATVDAEIELTP